VIAVLASGRSRSRLSDRGEEDWPALGRGVATDRRVFVLLDRLRTSFWALPMLLSLGAIVLSRLALFGDSVWTFESGFWDSLLYHGTPHDAQALLSSLAGSMVTVAGIVFSITIVTLSFASSELGPRLLRNFIRDRVTQFVLGCFVSIFLYEVLVLSSIRSGVESRIPRLSTSLGLWLATGGFAALVYFVHHVANSIRVENVLTRSRSRLDDTIERLFPDPLGSRPQPGEEVEGRRGLVHSIGARSSGYLAAVDYEHLVEWAEERDGLVVCSARPSQFLAEGDELVRANVPIGDADADTVAGCFMLGPQRTDAQDVEYAICELVEVALRALSPGVNDPFTAMSNIDHLGAALQYLLTRRGPVASSLFETGGFWYADPDARSPDVQLHLGLGTGIESGVAAMPNGGVTLNACYLRPRSRGTVRLESSDPAAAPLIDPSYLADPRDRALSIEGLKLAQRIMAQPALKRFIEAERLPGPEVRSDDAYFSFICQHSKTSHHAAGTCRMGPDPEAVLDIRLRFNGIEGLRVADASIMPTVISSNTNAACIMIGEKAADMIRAEHGV
jgi:uncharacterized membrane protein